MKIKILLFILATSLCLQAATNVVITLSDDQVAVYSKDQGFKSLDQSVTNHINAEIRLKEEKQFMEAFRKANVIQRKNAYVALTTVTK